MKAKRKRVVLELLPSEFITLQFAIRNYRAQLEAEIKKPTRDHGPAESAMALCDVEELETVIRAKGGNV